MEEYTERKIISLNSIHANNKKNDTYLSDVEFFFKNILKDEQNIIRSTIQIINCLIPVSYYGINYTNDTLIVNGFNVSITRGNYNSSSLITELQTKILSTTGFSITITISRITGKLTFSSNNSFSIQPNNLSVILGFEAGKSYTSYYETVSILTAPYPLNLLGIKKIKIFSNALSTHSCDSYGMGNNSLINTVPINAPPFSLITYLQPTSPLILKQKTINTIDIQLRDEDNQFINFNNVPWCITLQIDIIRTQPALSNPTKTITDILEQELQKIDTDIQNLSQPLASTHENQPNQDNQNEDLNQQPLDSLDLLQYNGEI